MKQYTIDQLNDLLNRACEIITSLEGYANEHSHYPEHNRELQKSIDAFFDEIDYMNEDDEPECDSAFFNEIGYMNEDEPEYDSAGFTEEDRIVEGQYRVIIGVDPDQEAQDHDIFGENKI